MWNPIPILLLVLLPFLLLTEALPHRIPSVHTSAILARRLVALSRHGVLSTVFPPPSSSPEHGSAVPIGLPDYISVCDPRDVADPTLLAMPIATSFRNALRRGANISLAVAWDRPARGGGSGSGGGRGWGAEMPRVALVGYLDVMGEEEVRDGKVEECFVKSHPDAGAWSFWVRLVVTEVYWVGGFGDRAFIGWIPVEQWRGVTRDEMDRVRLPGEETMEEIEMEGEAEL